MPEKPDAQPRRAGCCPNSLNDVSFPRHRIAIDCVQGFLPRNPKSAHWKSAGYGSQL
jgi:hypothetical protein